MAMRSGETRVNLVIEKTVNLYYAAANMFSFVSYFIDELSHLYPYKPL